MERLVRNRLRLLVLMTAGAGCVPDGPTVSERTVADDGAYFVRSSQGLINLADSLFGFAPTVVDTSETPEDIALAIQAKASASLAGCGSATVADAGVTIVAPECALANGVTLSGTVLVEVTKTGSTVTVELFPWHVSVGVTPLSGRVPFATTDGVTFAVVGNDVGSVSLYMCDLSFASTPQGVTVNGTARERHDYGTRIAFTDVVTQVGQCFPNAGTIGVGQARSAVDISTTFLPDTPSTGQVTLTVRGESYPGTVPSYGKCPPG